MPVQVAMRQSPCFGEVSSGDGVVVLTREQGALIVVIDVLGHGDSAALLAREMEMFIKECPVLSLTGLMEMVHQHFKGTLGAAITMLSIDFAKNLFQVVGVGNVLLRKHDCGKWVSFHAQSGIVCEMIPTLISHEGTFETHDLFIMTSDGIRENIPLEEELSLLYWSPSQIAGYMMDHFSKHYDDATVVVARCHNG
ncbi:SpoIIE family protein phosphatase [Aeromonas sp. MdU4]|uniref:SpoIIE family protein phosphatase n=1 Tax=Aeromonas sp. MdU4 TaxID=3342819 RepID=UPI0035B8B920